MSMDNETTTVNSSILINDTLNYDPEETEQHLLYNIFITILLISCLIAMFLNVVIIISIYWIKSPMSPRLKISLSLAAADALSSTLYAANLIGINLFLEIVKLMGISVTVAHLLTLSLNHYLSILKPLHYNSIVTNMKPTMVILLLWTCPVLIVGGLCAIESNNEIFDWDILSLDGSNKTNTGQERFQFMNRFRFRISYSSLFFIPMILMAICYTHILYIVRKQQKVWKNLSRIGSTKWRGRTINGCSTNRMINEQKQLEGNLRAICTTLLILGSCFVGWMPALLIFSLMCQEGCLLAGDELIDFNKHYWKCIMIVRLIENLLVIMKMLVNAIIYSIRIKEIKDSLSKMHKAIITFFCRSPNNNHNYSLACQRSPIQNSGTSIQIRITSFRNNNGACRERMSQPEHNTFL